MPNTDIKEVISLLKGDKSADKKNQKIAIALAIARKNKK